MLRKPVWRIEPAPLIDRNLNASIWQKGLSLGDALLRFCPRRLRRQLENTYDPKLLECFPENVRKVTWEDIEAWRDLGSALPEKFIKILIRREKMRDEMRAWLRAALGNGTYAAYGDWPPLGPNNPANLIRAEYFLDGEIDWTKLLLKIGDTEIIAIRVFRLSWVKKESVTAAKEIQPAPEIQDKTNATKVKKRGRRASPEIVAVIRELDREPGFRSLRRDIQTDMVIEQLDEKYPDRFPGGKGRKRSTVARYLFEQLEGEKT